MLNEQNYDAIVEAIYESAIDPLHWSQVIDRVTTAFDVIGASIFTPFANRLGVEPVWSTNADPEFIQAYASEYAKRDILADALWRHVPIEAFSYRWEDIIDRQAIEAWDGYQDLLMPRGVHTGVGVICDGTDHRVGQLMIYVPKWPDERLESAKHALMRLGRHMRRAMSIHWHLSMARQSAATAQITLDMFKTGVMWLSPNGEVLYRNAEMDRILELRDGMDLRSGRIHISVTENRNAYQDAIVKAASGESTTMAIARESDASSFCIKVMPLPLSASALRLPNASAIAFVSEPGRSPKAAGDVARVYGLTPAETRILERLVGGGTVDAISNEFGTSLATVRTQLKAVLAKCGVSRQADLIRIVADFPPVGT